SPSGKYHPCQLRPHGPFAWLLVRHFDLCAVAAYIDLETTKESPMSFPKPGTPEWLAAKASGPKWRYADARGVAHVGYMERSLDLGGSDVSYYMRDGETGDLSVVSGSRAKEMQRV